MAKKKNKKIKIYKPVPLKNMPTSPKVLVYDIETAPILGHVWRLWDQNVGLNQIVSDYSRHRYYE